MTVRELKPRPQRPSAPSEQPQCCEHVEPPTRAQMWRRDRYVRLRPHYDPDRCQRESSVEIDGRPYCRIHAGRVALERWLSGELVSRDLSE